MRMIAGRWTVEFLAELNFAVAFVLGRRGHARAGPDDVAAAAGRRVNAARANAARSVGLIDSTKFGRASLLSIAPAQELDAIVTDAGLDAETSREDVSRRRRAARDRDHLEEERWPTRHAVHRPVGRPAARASSPRSARAGASTGSSWPAGATTSTSPRAVATPATRRGSASCWSGTASTAGRSARTSSARRCATRSTSATRACCRPRCGATATPRACASARRSA